MATSRKYEIGVGLLLAGALGLLAWMALRVGALQGPGDYIHVEATLSDAGGLTPGAVVSIAGVQVGRVESLSVDFDQARLVLSLEKDSNIREDVQLRLRARSVLGEKYLQLIPVSRDAPLLQEGGVIHDAKGQVEIDQLVTRLSPVIEALDPKDLQRALGAVVSALEEDPERPARMLSDAETTLHNISVASSEFPTLIQDARTTLAVVRSTASEARPIMARADRTIAALETRINEVPPDQITDLIEDVDLAVADAHGLMNSINERVDVLDKVLHNLEEIDKWELRRLLREEGIKVRLVASEVVVPEGTEK